MAAKAIKARFNSDTSDFVGPTTACSCGEKARYVERRSKNFETVLGTLRLERAYYHCRYCEQGFCPRDHRLGLNNTSLSPALRRMTATVGSTSFQEGRDVLWELAAVRVDAKQVERVSEALGREIAEDEKHFIEPSSPPLTASTLYLSMDGTGVPMRKSELAGNRGKQPGGSAKTREAKLCTICSAESRDEKGHPIRDPGSISYSAAIESAANRDTDETPSPFAERVLREAQRQEFDQASRRVILGDGAPWIRNISDMHFPDAIQIFDRFHAKKHLSDVAKAIYGAQNDLAKNSASDVMTNSMTDALTPFYVPYVAIARTARRHVSASAISVPPGIGCAIRNLRRSTCAPLLPLSNPVASSSSPPGSKAPECIGAYPEPAPFSHFDVLA